MTPYPYILLHLFTCIIVMSWNIWPLRRSKVDQWVSLWSGCQTCYQVPIKIFDEMVVDKYDSKHTGSFTNVQAKFGQEYKLTIINVCIRNLWELYVWMKEHQSLLTCMGVCIDTGYILGTNSLIGTGHRDIFRTVVIT